MNNPEIRITGRPGRPESWREVLAVYVQLTKPRIIELLLIATVPSMIAAAGGWPGLWLVAATLIGGTLSAAGANTINSVADRDIDRIMRRTRSRPLPSGRVEPGSALLFGASLGASGFLFLWATTNLLSAVLSSSALLFYVFVYTLFLKRTSVQNIVVGGAAGGVPALVGWGGRDRLARGPCLGDVRDHLPVDAAPFLGALIELPRRITAPQGFRCFLSSWERERLSTTSSGTPSHLPAVRFSSTRPEPWESFISWVQSVSASGYSWLRCAFSDDLPKRCVSLGGQTSIWDLFLCSSPSTFSPSEIRLAAV